MFKQIKYSMRKKLIGAVSEANNAQSFDLEEIKTNIRILTEKTNLINAKLDLYLLQLYRKEHETTQEAKERFFNNIPDASGRLLMYQKANTKLLSKLLTFCAQADVQCWMWSGSAIATVARHRAIPWDDDIDVCMMREDFLKLEKTINESNEYYITTVYDFLAKNKQYRFISKNPMVYNFIDIVVCDWGTLPSIDKEEQYKKIKSDLEDEFNNKEMYNTWRSASYISASCSPINQYNYIKSLQEEKNIEYVFKRAFQSAFEKDILCKKEYAKSVVYGIDNLFNSPDRIYILAKDVIFPLKKMKYENIDVFVPRKYREFCSASYKDWPFIPNDILEYRHMPEGLLDNPEILVELEKFINQD